MKITLKNLPKTFPGRGRKESRSTAVDDFKDTDTENVNTESEE